MKRPGFIVGSVAALLLSGASAAELSPEEATTVEAYEKVVSSVVLVLVEGLKLDPAGQSVTKVQVTGSGFSIRPGVVVTNYHVIQDAMRIEIALSEGRSAPAVVLGTAPGYDLALLRVPFDAGELPPAELASRRDLRVGQKVIAVSNPLGLEHSVSAGIVSGLNRELPGLDLGSSLIQFDAPINPGQSGGPLVDSSGVVVGVTTTKIRDAEAIGFAIPIDIVKTTVRDLERMGHAFRPELGFAGIGVSPDLAKLLDLPVEWGVMVQEVKEGGPAAEVGLEVGHRRVFLRGVEFILGGDIIVGINERVINSPSDLAGWLLSTAPGQPMTLSVVGPRGHRKIELTVPEMRH